MHDRGDYKFGWQLEVGSRKPEEFTVIMFQNEWQEAQDKKEGGQDIEDSSDDEKYVISSDDENMPKKCSLCSKVFKTPVITK
jgi:hypothetical protein